jgi:hypothetical protein
VGPDVTRFVMLTRKNDAPLDFDFDKVLEQSKDNPVFYVQYAHARISSVLRKAEEAGIDISMPADLSPSTIRRNSRWSPSSPNGRVWWRSPPQGHEPHRVAFYLYDLASSSTRCGTGARDDPGQTGADSCRGDCHFQRSWYLGGETGRKDVRANLARGRIEQDLKDPAGRRLMACPGTGRHEDRHGRYRVFRHGFGGYERPRTPRPNEPVAHAWARW